MKFLLPLLFPICAFGQLASTEMIHEVGYYEGTITYVEITEITKDTITIEGMLFSDGLKDEYFAAAGYSVVEQELEYDWGYEVIYKEEAGYFSPYFLVPNIRVLKFVVKNDLK